MTLFLFTTMLCQSLPKSTTTSTKAVSGGLPRYISWGQTTMIKTYHWSMGMGIKPLQICTPGSEELYFPLIQKVWREVPDPDTLRQPFSHWLLCRHWRYWTFDSGIWIILPAPYWCNALDGWTRTCGHCDGSFSPVVLSCLSSWRTLGNCFAYNGILEEQAQYLANFWPDLPRH